MRKCEHGVRIPEGMTGYLSPYCSGCVVPEDPLVQYRSDFTPFPYGEKKCPVCGNSAKFKFIDEWRYHCFACGADALND